MKHADHPALGQYPSHMKVSEVLRMLDEDGLVPGRHARQPLPIQAFDQGWTCNRAWYAKR